jgi:DNA-directed RNA polymerase subunit RPC12/RpoP
MLTVSSASAHEETHMNHFCPGSSSLRRDITLEIKTCPECGADVELFSIDQKARCDNCGFVVYNKLQSCIQWCRYAKECVGEEVYAKYMTK